MHTHSSGARARRLSLGACLLVAGVLSSGLLKATTPYVEPAASPVFTAMPYVQPGPLSELKEGEESIRLLWQTLQTEASYEVSYGRTDRYEQKAEVKRLSRDYRGKGDKDSRFNYVSELKGLQLGNEYRYRVRCNGNTIAEGYVTTRQPRGHHIRFVAFGDNAFGDPSERAIAFQAYRLHPDFIQNTGDNVYDSGLDSEYTHHFFPIYNADFSAPSIGAPILRSIPFYVSIANHDIEGQNPDTKAPCANFAQNADSLAYFTNFTFPLNGPVQAQPPSTYGPDSRLNDFKQAADGRFPRMANYSYDVGDAHILCLDSNIYVDTTDEALQHWVEEDLSKTNARWKFVIFHHPPFNVGAHHGKEQHMRAFAQLWEKYGVNFVLSGHEHNYQRTQPIHFIPTDLTKAKSLNSKDRLVPGKFTIDRQFDGEKVTHPDGIIYITTGAGGKFLYDPEYQNAPEKWTLAEDQNIAYVTRMITDRHSLTVFDVDHDEIVMRQIDEHGNELDRIRVSR